MSNFAITTKMNIYIPMEEDIIKKWGSMNDLKEDVKNPKENKCAKDFTFRFLEEIIKEALKTKEFSFLPLSYGVNENSENEFKILVAITFETTYSNLYTSNDKLIKMETTTFYQRLVNILQNYNFDYQIYDSALV